VRDTPELMSSSLRPHAALNSSLTALQMMARQERDLEAATQHVSKAEQTWWGVRLGRADRSRRSAHQPEVQALPRPGNRLKQQVGVL